MLEYFMRHAGQLLTHMQIHQHLWKMAINPVATLAALIRLLRRKIEASGETPLVHTVYGKGYRFGAASVETIDFAAFLNLCSLGNSCFPALEEVLCA